MINVALFGLGRIGRMHGENLHAHKKFNLKYTFDINKNLSLIHISEPTRPY